ncbi:MAG: hypothetical protein JJT90_00825 [Ectothiorhodospiraceae bacterium]|nr:hypothetical protein [Ectothiorhodospiraceae bacterium]
MSTRLAAFARLNTGDSASISRRYSHRELQTWARIARAPESGDQVPEPLIAALFSYLLGEKLPGHGTNYLKQHMRFPDHGRVDEKLTATVTITRLRPDKALVNLASRCTGEDGRIICDGESLVLFKR